MCYVLLGCNTGIKLRKGVSGIVSGCCLTGRGLQTHTALGKMNVAPRKVRGGPIVCRLLVRLP